MVKQILPDETESWNFWIYSRASRWYQFLIHFKIFLFSTSVTTKKDFRWIGCRRIRAIWALSLWPSNLTQERLLKAQKTAHYPPWLWPKTVHFWTELHFKERSLLRMETVHFGTRIRNLYLVQYPELLALKDFFKLHWKRGISVTPHRIICFQVNQFSLIWFWLDFLTFKIFQDLTFFDRWKTKLGD